MKPKKSLFHRLMAKLVHALDFRFDKYRDKPIAVNEKIKEKERKQFAAKLEKAVEDEHQNYTPRDEKELIQAFRRTSKDILSPRKRNLISGAMSFDKRKAILITMPREDIVFLNDSDFLGPVKLDKLYKTGETIFPVLNKSKKVCGLIRTDNIDLLHITKDQPVTKLMENNVAFARTDYTLEQLLAVFLRNHTDYVLIIDEKEQLVGYAELNTLIAILFNREIKDDFTGDNSSLAVSQRKLDS